MNLDVVDLRNFYSSPLGAVSRRVLRGHIRAAWSDVSGMNIAGVGYPLPYLDMFRLEANHIVALMPDSIGGVAWPDPLAESVRQNPRGGNRSVLVLEEALPLPDSSMDRILLIHCMEASETIRPLLREIWRVLTPQGRLLLILPNRLGMWARAEHTPFGHGRPWTRTQLTRFLREVMYTPESCQTCLHIPPLQWACSLRWVKGWEKIGTVLYPGLSGLLLAEASKQVHASVLQTGFRTPVARRMLWRPG